MPLKNLFRAVSHIDVEFRASKSSCLLLYLHNKHYAINTYNGTNKFKMFKSTWEPKWRTQYTLLMINIKCEMARFEPTRNTTLMYPWRYTPFTNVRIRMSGGQRAGSRHRTQWYSPTCMACLPRSRCGCISSGLFTLCFSLCHRIDKHF
jgi:hypothetical protein